MTDAKRKTLKQKVQAGEARNKAKTENTTTIFDRAGEAAIEAKDKSPRSIRSPPSPAASRSACWSPRCSGARGARRCGAAARRPGWRQSGRNWR